MTFGDRFYSVAELADVTGYHRDSIYRAIESGALAAAKPRGKWLIAGAAINAWLRAADTNAPVSEPVAVLARQPVVVSRPAAPRSAKATRRRASGARPSFRELARRRRAT
jgi:excisionase family DNA binding protein